MAQAGPRQPQERANQAFSQPRADNIDSSLQVSDPCRGIFVVTGQQDRSAWTRADVIEHPGRVLPRTGMDPAAAVALLEDLTDRVLASEFEPVVCLEAPGLAEVLASLRRADARARSAPTWRVSRAHSPAPPLRDPALPVDAAALPAYYRDR